MTLSQNTNKIRMIQKQNDTKGQNDTKPGYQNPGTYVYAK